MKMNRRTFLQGTAAAALGTTLLPITNTFCTTVQDVDPEAFKGRPTFDRLLKMAGDRSWASMPIGERIGAIGMEMRGIPYVGATLELSDDREMCSVNLLGLDCVTFFESALGFAHMIARGESMAQALLDRVTFTRYRGGVATDYTSRLHYTVDWFHDNEKKRIVRMITHEMPGAVRFTRTVNYMSTHPSSYRQLKANPKFVPVIAGIEREINAREMYYVPKERVTAIEERLQTGDIIGITTTIEGIDCSHTGLCYRDEHGTLRLLHASLTKKEVTLDEELAKYLAGVSKHTGIMIARPL